MKECLELHERRRRPREANVLHVKEQPKRQPITYLEGSSYLADLEAQLNLYGFRGYRGDAEPMCCVGVYAANELDASPTSSMRLG